MKRALFALAFLFLVGAYAYPLCQEQTDSDDIPCIGITAPLECSGNITVTNLNTSQTYNITTSLYIDTTYNFTFNFTSNSYLLKSCDNSTATIDVGDYEGDKLWKLSIILAIIAIGIIYILSGRIIFDKEHWIVITSMNIAGFLAIIIAVQIALLMSTKVSQLTGLTSALLTITWGVLGIFMLYLFIFYTTAIVRSVKESRGYKANES